MKKKLLVVLQHFRRGGVELAAINFAEHLNKDKYDITYYLLNVSSEHDRELEKEIRSAGSHIIIRDSSINKYISGYRDALRVMRETNYDIVHSHVMFYSGIITAAAKKCGIKKRAAHSHGSKWNHRETLPFKIYSKIMRALIKRCATDKFACGTDAGNYLYGKKEYKKHGTFIPNGIDISKYSLNEAERAEKRNELGIEEGELLVGHIGTVYRIKNQSFLIDVFAEMLKTVLGIKLVLAGEIVDRELITNKIKDLNLEEKILLLGPRSDVPPLLKAFDIMIFPSLNEGLPVSLIEAQAAKLPCLVSDGVTKEVKLNENVDFMSLQKPAEEWGKRAFELMKINRESIDISKLAENYDINRAAEKLDLIYNS